MRSTDPRPLSRIYGIPNEFLDWLRERSLAPGEVRIGLVLLAETFTIGHGGVRQTREFQITDSELARLAGVSERSVRRALPAMDPILEVLRTRGQPTRYRLRWSQRAFYGWGRGEAPSGIWRGRGHYLGLDREDLEILLSLEGVLALRIALIGLRATVCRRRDRATFSYRQIAGATSAVRVRQALAQVAHAEILAVRPGRWVAADRRGVTEVRVAPPWAERQAAREASFRSEGLRRSGQKGYDSYRTTSGRGEAEQGAPTGPAASPPVPVHQVRSEADRLRIPHRRVPDWLIEIAIVRSGLPAVMAHLRTYESRSGVRDAEGYLLGALHHSRLTGALYRAPEDLLVEQVHRARYADLPPESQAAEIAQASARNRGWLDELGPRLEQAMLRLVTGDRPRDQAHAQRLLDAWIPAYKARLRAQRTAA